MDFTVEYPVSYYQEGEYRGNNKIKIHRNAQLGLLSNIKTIGRVGQRETYRIVRRWKRCGTSIRQRSHLYRSKHGHSEWDEAHSMHIRNRREWKHSIVRDCQVFNCRRESPYISIGNGVVIKRNCTLQALRIGDNVVIGNNCTLVFFSFQSLHVGRRMCDQRQLRARR